MGKVDRQALEILADRPNPLPVVTVKNEELKQQHDFGDMGLIGLCFLYKRMRESEEVLYNKIEGIKNGTNPPVPLYFQEVIEAAQSIRKANLNNTCFGPKQLDYPTLVKAWGEEKLLKKNKARTVQSHCSKVLLIADLLGDKHINDLTRKDIKELEKDLLQVPQRCFQKYPNKSIREIIAETKGKKDIKRLDDSTVRDYIVAFGTFVKYLIDEDIVCYDPFQNYHFKCATSAKESYLPFTDDDLKKIFNPQTYPLLDAKQSEDVAKAFIPLLALFLGSRLNELCQLDVDDVQMISGVQCVVIAPDDKETSKTTEEAKRTKTQKSRINPIPQKIIDLGFLEYVEQRKKAGYKKLFDLGYVEGQGSGNAIGKWFSRYLTRIGIKTRLKVFHSFRHLLPQTLTNMRLPPSYAKEIGGWSQNDSSAFSCYQNGHIPITTLRDVVNQMEFPMIDFEALKNRTMDDLIIKPIVKRRRSVLGDKLPKGQKVKLP
jgi:integrase